MNCLITWDGECNVNARWHACIRDSEFHPGEHICACGARTTKFRNPPPPREPVKRFYQKVLPRASGRPFVRRDDSHYLPKYMKRERGIVPEVKKTRRDDLFIFDENGDKVELGPCVVVEVEVDAVVFHQVMTIPRLDDPAFEALAFEMAERAVLRKAGLA